MTHRGKDRKNYNMIERGRDERVMDEGRIGQTLART